MSTLARKRSAFDRAGRQLLEACDGTIFPGDVYFIATCNRALQNFDAFRMAMTADYYSTAMILLRVQLDSVLRCYGLTLTLDPHEAAYEILQGKKLSKLKDKSGVPLKDVHLVETFSKLAPSNAAILHIYDLSSGYVHLSRSAMNHVLAQTKTTTMGQRGFYIGSAEPEVPAFAKLQLIQAFDKITEALVELAAHWAGMRNQFGQVDELIKRFGPQAVLVATDESAIGTHDDDVS